MMAWLTGFLIWLLVVDIVMIAITGRPREDDDVE